MDAEWCRGRSRGVHFVLLIPTSTFHSLILRLRKPSGIQAPARVLEWAEWAPGGALLVNVPGPDFMPSRIVASPFGPRCALLKVEGTARAIAEAEVLIFDLNPLARPGPGVCKPSDKVTSRILDPGVSRTADETIRSLLRTACMPYTVYPGPRLPGRKLGDECPTLIATDTSGFTIMVCYSSLLL